MDETNFLAVLRDRDKIENVLKHGTIEELQHIATEFNIIFNLINSGMRKVAPADLDLLKQTYDEVQARKIYLKHTNEVCNLIDNEAKLIINPSRKNFPNANFLAGYPANFLKLNPRLQMITGYSVSIFFKILLNIM